MIYSFEDLSLELKGMAVLIVGGGPDANKITAKQYEEYDYIVRINNFKYANECKRTDIWFSYWGRNIKDVEKRIKDENIKALVCKYPENDEFGWVYEINQELFDTLEIPVYKPTVEQSFQTNNNLDISPTAGLCAIITVLRCRPALIRIIGFDFFTSKVHNLNDTWDGSGGHEPEKEKQLVESLIRTGDIEWLK